MWARAEIDEVAILETRDLFAFGDLVDEVEFEAGRIAGAFAEAAETAGFGHGFRFIAGDRLVFEFLVFLGDFLHLRLDFFEVVRSDPVLHFEIVVEAIFDRRAVGELGVRPNAQDGGGHDVGAGMAEPLQVGHLLALVESLAVVHGAERETPSR